MSFWTTLRGKPIAGGKRAVAMQRIQWVLGVCSIIAVAAVWANGLLDKFERDSIDFRAKYFPSVNAQPSNRIVIVAIDDAAIDNVGRWPWDREKLAAVIDEMTTAGASVVALDLLLDDRQEPRPVARGDGFGRVIDDDILAAAMKHHGRVISAVSFKFERADESAEVTDKNVIRVPMPEIYRAMAAQPGLIGKPWEDVFDAVRPALPSFKTEKFTQGKDVEKLRLRWEAATTITAREADSSLPLVSLGTPWAVSIEPAVPVAPIAQASRRLANVTFDSYDPDGLTRRIPLVVEHHQRLWPTLGVAAAIEYYNARASDSSAQVQLLPEGVRIGLPDAEERVLASFTQRLGSRDVAGLHLVSWPRGVAGGDINVTGWRRQFYDNLYRKPSDPGAPPGRTAELPIGRLYEPVHLASAVNENVLVNLQGVIDKNYRALGVIDSDRDAQWAAIRKTVGESPVNSPEWLAAVAKARQLFAAANDDAQTILGLSPDTPEASLAPEVKQQLVNVRNAYGAVKASFEAIDEGLLHIVEIRKELRERLSGSICFVGWTATGSLADFVATSIDPRTPGVHLHAAVCNSVLTGFQRVPGPMGGQLLIVASLGLVGTWIGVRSSVVAGPLLVIGALLVWALFASLVLWSMYDRIWSVAGPTVAASASWLIVVLHRLLVEQRSRRKTEERFKSYVSPAVVDILVQNPSLNSMAPQQKELTVLFSDIAGFTTTAERLGSQATAELLAVYLGTMTEVVQRHGATLDKYIGDAIMAFWGAPVDDLEHARHACTAAVEMMQTVDKLNAADGFGAAGKLSIRIGLATGDLMVGDFGNPPRNSSYTVIGDTVNLGARLEGASKVFGTRTLVSDRTRQLAGEGFLWRTIGIVKVKGKHSGIAVHELLPGPVKGEQTAAWIALCDSLIEDYRAERFEAALAKAVQLRETHHDEGFASAYGEAIAARQAGLAEGEFDGSITLTEK